MGGRHLLSSICAELREIVFDSLPLLLPVLFSIGLTQAAWVGIYDCKVTRNIFRYESDNSTEGNLDELGSITEGITNAAIALTVFGFASVLMVALVLGHCKRIIKSWQALSSVVCAFVIAGTIFQDGAAMLPVDEAVQLAIGAAATTVLGGFTVLTLFTENLPTRYRQLSEITICSAIAIFYLTLLPGSTAWFFLSAVALSDIIVTLGPFGHLVQAFLHDNAADTLRSSFFSTVTAPDDAAGDVTDDDDEEAVVFARPVRRLAAGRDHQQPRERGRNILPIRRQMQDSDSGSEDETEEEEEEEKGVTTLGLGFLILSSIHVGSSMVVGALPALCTTVGVLSGVMHTVSTPEYLPNFGISFGLGMVGHCIGLGSMAAISYVNDVL